MAFTKVTNAGIGSTGTVLLHNLNVVGTVTATDGIFSGIGSFGGNVSVGGTLTYEDVTNVDSVGLITARNGINVIGAGVTIRAGGLNVTLGVSTFSGNVTVGTGITLSPDGDGYYTGVVTATSYKGDGSALTGITQILTGNTSVQTVDTGSDGHVKITTEGTERGRFDATGLFTMNGKASLGKTATGVPFAIGDSGTNGHKVLHFKRAAATNDINIQAINSGSGATSLLLNSEGGNVLTGHTATYGSGLSQIFHTTQYCLDLSTWSADANGPTIDFYKSRNATKGSATIVQSGDVVGRLRFLGNDGANARTAAQITAESDGTPGTNDMPGRLVFSTTRDGASSPTEALRIDSTGRVLINQTTGSSNLCVSDTNPVIAELHHSDGGTNDQARISLGALANNPPSNRGVNLIGENNGAGHDFVIACSPSHSGGPAEKLRVTSTGDLKFSTGSRASNVNSICAANGHSIDINGTEYLYFRTNNTEVGRFNTNKRFCVGTTNDDGGGSANTDDGCVLREDGLIAARVTTGTNTIAFVAKTIDTGGATALRCMSAQTQVGGVTFNSGATSFNTSSDYRRKENLVSITDGITKVKQLKTYRFNFKDNPSETVDGFLAHEAQEVIPFVVSGTKDEVATEDRPKDNIKKGDPIYQQLDQSKLVPLLTAALQESIAKIETLETEVAALKSA